MELFGLVQTLIEVCKSREEYSEEVKKMQIQLEFLCQNLKHLNNNNISKTLHQRIETQLEEAKALLKKLPEQAGILHAVASKLPFMNLLQEIKDKNAQLQESSNLLNSSLLSQMVIQQNKSLPVPNRNVGATMLQTQEESFEDPSLATQQKVRVNLKLVADDHVKSIFRVKTLHTNENLEVKFKQNAEETDVHKFGRSYYECLKPDIAKIDTISGEHAIIRCRRVPKPPTAEGKKDDDQFVLPPQKPKPQAPQLQQPDEEQALYLIARVFFTCLDELEPPKEEEPDPKYYYYFYLENLGKMGVFLYRDDTSDEEKKADQDQKAESGAQAEDPELPRQDVTLAKVNGLRKFQINSGQWNRLQGKKAAFLKNKDKIGILMKAPDYRQPLIAYEFGIV